MGEIATTYSGGTPKAGNKKYYNGLIPFIRSGEIHSNKTELFISEAGLKNSSAKMVTKGDLLYALYGATSGEVDISKINGAINQAVLAIIPKQYNPYIISLLLSKKKDAILSKYLQGGQGNLSAEIVKSIKLILPSKNEESSLYPLFKVLDNLLSLQQRKLELEKQIFYALKTHIFAKDLFFNGQKDMIKYKLKDVSNMYQPETITATQMSTNGYKVFGANGYIGHYYNFNHKDDAITICARGASTGAVNFVPGPVWITGNSMVVDIDSKLINQLYFYYYLTTLNLKKYITGGAQPQLTKEILNGINVNLIPINIQIKVANILVLKLSNFLCK
ncbi:restriction endonuclease subunit S [Lactobacillus jensenii]|uniref:restriction endonuclease subunit S n=1 Tax=Lactobacillus jensenii TaxID=109790 RepID=UPI0036F4A9ED|nr:restriction endonuclease subunit S [Lactobacillus jensenii]MCZ3736902.1 restriction endonuclease subunit S [Lactobacillus jensenii]